MKKSFALALIFFVLLILMVFLKPGQRSSTTAQGQSSGSSQSMLNQGLSMGVMFDGKILNQLSINFLQTLKSSLLKVEDAQGNFLSLGMPINSQGLMITTLSPQSSSYRILDMSGKEQVAQWMVDDVLTGLRFFRLTNTQTKVVPMASGVTLGEWILSTHWNLSWQDVQMNWLIGHGKKISKNRLNADVATLLVSAETSTTDVWYFNLQGELAGVRTTANRTQDSTAWASEELQLWANSVERYGRVVRGAVGLDLQEVTGNLARALKLNLTSGALVAGVDSASPAEAVGLRAGDVIVQAGVTKIISASQLNRLISQTAPSTEITLSFLRDNQARSVVVTVQEMK